MGQVLLNGLDVGAMIEDQIEEAIAFAEYELQRDLDEEERESIIGNFLDGFED